MDAESARRRARIRLRNLSVHAVALVPEGANLVRWADVRKSEGTMDTTTTQEGTAKALVLPKAAQDALVAGLNQAVEALMGLLDMTRAAQVTEDAGAMVPPELASNITQIGMMLTAMGDQYAGGGGIEIEVEPQDGMTPEQTTMAKELAKSLAVKLAKGIGPVAKGRVKSWDQMMKLQSGLMAKLYEIASELAPLVSEGGADMIEAMKPGAAGAAAETQKAAPAAPAAAPAGGAAQDVTSGLQRLEKGMSELRETVGKIAKTRLPPTGSSSPEGSGEAPAFRIPYGENLSAQFAKK